MHILHVGTSNLWSNKSLEKLSEKILNLAESLKLRDNTVATSNNDLLKKIPEEFGPISENLCKNDNSKVILHWNINTKREIIVKVNCRLTVPLYQFLSGTLGIF